MNSLLRERHSRVQYNVGLFWALPVLLLVMSSLLSPKIPDLLEIFETPLHILLFMMSLPALRHRLGAGLETIIVFLLISGPFLNLHGVLQSSSKGCLEIFMTLMHIITLFDHVSLTAPIIVSNTNSAVAMYSHQQPWFEAQQLLWAFRRQQFQESALLS